MKQRIRSIDIIRGLIMIIMTLDHSRDFLHYAGQSPTNMQTTTVVLFFTRWITHFCAPTFVFLGGLSAFLAGQRRSKKELSLFLIKRGLWLILSDLLIISLLFSFDIGYHMLVLEVLWATGCGMILLGLLIHTNTRVIAAIGLVIFFGHNLLDYITLPKTGVMATFTSVLLTAKAAFIPIGNGRNIVELYAALPWAGVLLLGYVFGRIYKPDIHAQNRRQILMICGVFLSILFLVLRFINRYGDPAPWSSQQNAAHTVLSFLNATKQVPSLMFFCMTLGPVLILMAIVEKMNTGFTRFCEVYGNTPYFYFIIHILLLRVLNILLILITGVPMKSKPNPLVWQAIGFGQPLWAVYLYWILVILLLYYPCKWYGDYKRAHSHWWLSYV
jgi:uncharacterized membrane protein